MQHFVQAGMMYEGKKRSGKQTWCADTRPDGVSTECVQPLCACWLSCLALGTQSTSTTAAVRATPGAWQQRGRRTRSPRPPSTWWSSPKPRGSPPTSCRAARAEVRAVFLVGLGWRSTWPGCCAFCKANVCTAKGGLPCSTTLLGSP